MIHTKNLSKKFRTDEVETTALLDLNVRIDQGGFLPWLVLWLCALRY